MDNQPFKKWGSGSGSVSFAFAVLIAIGFCGALWGYAQQNPHDAIPQITTMTTFALYGGIVALVIGIVGVIAAWGK